MPDADLAAQREVVDAFFAAARAGDFDGLVAVLDPDVVLRSDGGARRPDASAVLRGAAAVAGRAIRAGHRRHRHPRPAAPSSLLSSGLTRPDPHRLGIDADGSGAVVDAFGRPSAAIFTLGENAA